MRQKIFLSSASGTLSATESLVAVARFLSGEGHHLFSDRDALSAAHHSIILSSALGDSPREIAGLMDAFVFEASGMDFEKGLWMAWAALERKPVLVLVPKGKQASSSLREWEKSSDFCSRVAYYSRHNIKAVVAGFLQSLAFFTERENSVKFTLRVQPKLLGHLRGKAHRMGITSARLLRDLIREDFLKSL
ncbi:MAG: hypothetical protein G01um101418_184 [Parcubacteria group bacterium Gr01-1014_18]|nr:MAG: hypothetical protein Greene041636_152 [Parcubacteria group bacterium Greene0416_36]TSC81344.1 MAG: hypothetical protein G01um101418_184 [Parcubacteria group bacterium Gr01-1014_18]TSC99470.1 MAG: hypothetical protein Greene101420_137 [Parcubacteria group bacterium Greene1014_20]TSD07611.1 MAG: hypothetical protein Greene07142_68 [Parcubacteria group bacterium Greene0714_2]